jgi:hypothetical protein
MNESRLQAGYWQKTVLSQGNLVTDFHFNCGNIIRFHCRSLQDVLFIVWSADWTGAGFLYGSRDWHAYVDVTRWGLMRRCASVSDTCGPLAKHGSGQAVVRLQAVLIGMTDFIFNFYCKFDCNWQTGLCVSWPHVPAVWRRHSTECKSDTQPLTLYYWG